MNIPSAKKKSAKRSALALAVCLLLPFCGGGQVKLENVKFRGVDLPEHGIKLYVPDFWERSPGTHFHYIATGNGPNNLPATLEYRGLETEATDATGKALYAQGWYEAIARNYDQKEEGARYKDWKYKTRRKITDDPEGAFEFEGTYRAGAIVYRKIGKLRFRGDRVHAIYYTAPDQDFRPVRRLFETIDEMHEYNLPNNGKK